MAYCSMQNFGAGFHTIEAKPPNKRGEKVSVSMHAGHFYISLDVEELRAALPKIQAALEEAERMSRLLAVIAADKPDAA